jgi:hypothetical protein
MDKDNTNYFNSNNSKKKGYNLSRQYFSYVEKYKDKIKPIHSALYFWIVELNNKLYWEEVIGLPTLKSMSMIGTKTRKRYSKTLLELEEWGFIKIITKSKNQYQSHRITLLEGDKTIDVEESRSEMSIQNSQDDWEDEMRYKKNRELMNKQNGWLEEGDDEDDLSWLKELNKNNN